MRLWIGLVVLTLVCGCVGGPPAPATSTTLRKGPTTTTLQVSQADISSVVESNNRFALDLYRQWAGDGGNVFYSPWSISTALAMTYEGARGQTASEMQDVLHIPDDDTRRNAFRSMQERMNSEGKDYELNTANALWPQIDYPFLPEYMGVVRDYYGGEATELDYKTKTEESRQTINTWVEDKTKDKIKNLIPPGVLNPMTRLVLTNAIYFKGTWVLEFDPDDTRDSDFRVTPEKTVKAEMMALTGDDAEFRYAETDDVQVLELPYEGEELSMLVILPKADDLAKVEEDLSLETLNRWRGSMYKQQVNVYIPKFKLETKYMMAESLKEMGMPTAFSAAADFSGMDGSRYLFISQVIHQAYVDVNEEGTEAAAATAVVMERLSISPTTVFRADHPFIFIIQERESGNILFMGKVADPTG
jgi:serpin B